MSIGTDTCRATEGRGKTSSGSGEHPTLSSKNAALSPR